MPFNYQKSPYLFPQRFNRIWINNKVIRLNNLKKNSFETWLIKDFVQHAIKKKRTSLLGIYYCFKITCFYFFLVLNLIFLHKYSYLFYLKFLYNVRLELITPGSCSLKWIFIKRLLKELGALNCIILNYTSVLMLIGFFFIKL